MKRPPRLTRKDKIAMAAKVKAKGPPTPSTGAATPTSPANCS